MEYLDRQTTAAWRGVCMLLIVAAHTTSDYCPPPGPMTAWLSTFCGQACTGYFFFMSAYGLSASLDSHPADGRYVWAKARRLLLPFACVCITYLVCELCQHGCWRGDWLPVFATLSLPGLDMWFFKTIVGYYILMFGADALMRLTGCRRWLWAAVSLSVTAYFVWLRWCSGWGAWWYVSVLNLPLGLLFYRFRGWIGRCGRLWLLAASVALLACGVACGIPTVYTLAFPLVLTFGIPRLGTPPRWLQYVGRNSLYFYLMECPVVAYLTCWRDLPVVYTAAVLLLTALLSWCWRKATPPPSPA